MVEASDVDRHSEDEPERPDQDQETTGRRGAGGSLLRETVVVIALALVIATLVRIFLVQAFLIPSGSMEDTLRVVAQREVGKCG